MHRECHTVKGDYGGCTLRVVTLPWEPLIIRHDTDNSTWYTGLGIDLLNYIASYLNFTYTLSAPADGTWGDKLPNGSWNGMVSMLNRKKADCVLGITVTSERASVSDYTTGFYYDELVLLASRPTVQTGWTFFLRPFHWLVYTVIGASLVIVTALHVCLIRYGDRETNRRQSQRTHGHRDMVTGAMTTLLLYYGALLARPPSVQPRSKVDKILLFTWLLMSLITAAIYGGKLTSLSVVKRAELPFKTLRELVHQDDYRWGYMPGTFYASLLQVSQDVDYRLFYRQVLEFAKEDPGVLSVDTATHINKVLHQHYVYLTLSSDYHLMKSTHCQLTRLPERLFTTTVAIFLQKDSPYTRDFNNAIERAKEFGLLDHWARKWFLEGVGCDSRQAEVTSLSLEHVQGAFLLAAIGVGVAMLLLTVERRVRDTAR